MLDLVAYHDPALHGVIRIWHYVAPAVAVLLAGSLALSVWRVWLQPRSGGGGRGTLPAWPASPNDEAPSLVIGELHHPTAPRETERPSWVVVPETGLYTGILIVGAVGSGKTSACMYPFAHQLLSWQADWPGRRASALVLEVKGDFCHAVRRILKEAGRGDDYLEIGLDGAWQWNPLDDPAARLVLARLHRLLADQPALRQEPRTVLAAGLHEPRALDRRTASAPAGGLGHAAGHLPLHDRLGALRREDRRGPGSGCAPLSGAGRRRRQRSQHAPGVSRRTGPGSSCPAHGRQPACSIPGWASGLRNSASRTRPRRPRTGQAASSGSRSRRSSGGT